MKTTLSVTSLAAATLLLAAPVSFAAKPTPGFDYKIPEEIMTPNKVKTSIGELHFYDGIPTDDTLSKVYDNLDFIRGIDVFLNFIPATSIEGIRIGTNSMGVVASNEVLIFDNLLDSAPFFLTGNTDTVYATAMLDLEKDGVTVVEVPAGSGPGTVNDAFFRFVVDMGAPGPDAKKRWYVPDLATGLQG